MERYFVSKEEIYEALDRRLPVEICEIILKYKREMETPMVVLLMAATTAIFVAMKMT
ncbi:hypothetical protein BNJ_00446 [Kaumoebavirus]|uniref:hypothetical protein n=1 Tax=Kaumoebavirus TaxID=1859492 RepID=UPI0009C38171|nr:hypothetical protein BNJ_00446 [Kaumoebavirus]ARA72258.1 hypothetical protein BNJ_00446 [Kaumoebavirus]